MTSKYSIKRGFFDNVENVFFGKMKERDVDKFLQLTAGRSKSLHFPPVVKYNDDDEEEIYVKVKLGEEWYVPSFVDRNVSRDQAVSRDLERAGYERREIREIDQWKEFRFR